MKCDDHEFPESAYPKVETLPVINISATGVTVQANLVQLSKQPIVNHGFVWGTTESLSLTSDENIKLGAISGLGKFEAEVKAGLFEGETYFVKAFVITADYLVYGKPVSFTSVGSTPPVLSEFSPLEATLGDTILLRGKYFGTKVSNIAVKFGSINSKIVSNTDTTIYCVVPNGIPNSVSIFVTVAGNQVQSPTNFKVSFPSIINFEPTTGTFGDVITIHGTGFSSIKQNNSVKFNEHQAEIVDVNRTRIIVKTPTTINAKENVLSVNVNDQTFSSTVKFAILPPVINSITKNTGLVGETIEIHGNNFNPESSGNLIVFGGREAPAITSTKTTITVKVPEGVYKNRSFKVGVTIAEQSAYTETFTLQNAWIRKADLPFGEPENMSPKRYAATAFSVDGFGYAGLGAGLGGDIIDDAFYKYDPAENTWTKVTTFPGGARSYVTSFVIDGLAYVGLGFGGSTTEMQRDFWRYDPQTNFWERIADFPLSNAYSIGIAYSAVVNGKGYIVTSSWGENFWEYDPVQDSWKQMPDLVFTDRYFQEAAFAAGNKLFVLKADDNYPPKPNQLWEFVFNSNSWVQKTNFIDDNYRWSGVPTAEAFSLGATGYILIKSSKVLYQYDIMNDSWERDFQNSPAISTYPLVFVVDGKAYFGTGNGSGSDIWEYDPAFR
jgi:N-acetylneuraminic acid mutarotase